MTRQARATRQVKPEIPENLRDEEFRKSVRARVSVSADGGFEVSLHGSSGNAQMDELALSLCESGAGNRLCATAKRSKARNLFVLSSR